MPSSTTDRDICNRALGRLGEERLGLTGLAENTPAGRACYLHYQPTVDEVLRSHRWNFAQSRVVLTPAPVLTLTVNTTLSTTVLTTSTTLRVGQGVTGTSIPTGATITAISSGVNFTLSVGPTVAVTNNTLTLTPYYGTSVTQPAFGWTYSYSLPGDFIRALEINESDENGSWTIEGQRLLTDETTVNLVYVARPAADSAGTWDTLFQEAIVLKLASKLATTLRGSASQVPDLLTEYERLIGPLARRVDANEGRERQPLLPLRSQFVAARYQGV